MSRQQPHAPGWEIYGFTLGEGPPGGPESKPEGRTILSFTNSPG